MAVLVTLIGFLLIVCCSSTKNDSPVLELKQGKLIGVQETSSDGKPFYSFLGIPYARPPVEALRFEEPMSPDRWEGVRIANEMPKECLQVDMMEAVKGVSKVTGSEDCLYLNIFTPKPLDLDVKWSVMVYIHGGGFMNGAASLYQPYFLLNENIVLVVIQYRLSVFGFMSTETSEMPGNMGLKDQKRALLWVRENIDRFGGDPEKVTIFGESAGAASAHLHMLSFGSAGLFNGVIAQSGNALCPWFIGDEHKNYSRAFGLKVGCGTENGQLAFKRCLQNKDGMSLLNTMVSLFEWGVNPKVLVPRVDEDFLMDHPETLLKKGKYNKVNLMTGVTRDEGAYFTMLMYSNPKLKKALEEDFNTNAPFFLALENEPEAANLSKKIFYFYLQGKQIKDDPMDEFTNMLGDTHIKVSNDLISFEHAKDKNINLFLYELNHKGQRSRLDSVDLGLPKHYISHVDDLFYLFSGGPLFGQPLNQKEDVELRKKMTKLWTNFAKFGNPTPPNSFNFTWRPATDSNLVHLSLTSTPSMMNYSRTDKLQFWKSLNTHQNRLLLATHEESFSLIRTINSFFINL